MKITLSAATLALALASPAMAQSRPSTVDRSCEASRALVARNGAIVLGTGGHTYDRFVASRNFCQYDELLDPAFVPSGDTAQCFVGYRCKTGPNWDD